MKRILLFVAAALFISSQSSFADTIPFNTGVDNTGQVLGTGAVDPHWTIVSEPSSVVNNDPPAYTVTSAAGYPATGPWLGDNSTSTWINPSSNNPGGNSLSGDWTYETTFNITGNPASYNLSGQFAADDDLVSILINGINVGPASAGGYNSWTPFTINSGFQSGTNTLDFVVDNFGGPTGVRVEFAQPVPEPGSMMLFGSGLLGLTGLIRRRLKTR